MATVHGKAWWAKNNSMQQTGRFAAAANAFAYIYKHLRTTHRKTRGAQEQRALIRYKHTIINHLKT